MLTPEQKRTRRGFLRDIRANPDDDTPRLIFADWLEDHGDLDHAALIRVQCERSAKGLTECVNRTSWPLVFVCEGADWTKKAARRCEYCRLTAEQDRVFWGWSTARLKATYEDPFLMCSQWDRGFIFRVKGFNFDWWHRWGPRICQEHPVERVELAGGERCVAEVSDQQWQSRLASMFPGWFADHYVPKTHPIRKTRDEAIAYINRVLLDWARSEAAKLDAAEDAKENDQ